MSGETDARPEIVAWVQAYAARTARQSELDAFVTRVDDTIMAAIPEIARDPALVRDLHASTRSQFQIFLSLLERPAQEVLLPPQAVDLALSLARRQLDLGVLLQVYRSASSAVWEYFTEVVRTADTGDLDRTDLLVYLWGHGGAWINGAVEQLIQVFSAEREATLQGAIARRSEVVHAVLRGEQVSLAEATAALGHPVREHHTAVVLWEDGEVVPDVLSRLAGVVGALGAALEASALSIPAGRAEAWAWLTSRTPIDAAAVRDAVDGVPVGWSSASSARWPTRTRPWTGCGRPSPRSWRTGPRSRPRPPSSSCTRTPCATASPRPRTSSATPCRSAAPRWRWHWPASRGSVPAGSPEQVSRRPG